MINQPSLFGTDGIRCRFGKDVFQKNELIKLTHAILQWIAQTHPNPHIAILRDTRASGEIIKTTFSAVGSLYHATFYDAGIMPTPAAPIIMQAFPPCSHALVITASHNSAEYNGIKIINSSGCKIETEDEHIINTNFYALEDKNVSFPASWQNNVIKIEQEAQEAYEHYIHLRINPSIHANKSYLLDTAQGAYSSLAHQILKQLGINTLGTGNTPNGNNSNKACGATYVEHILNADTNQMSLYRLSFDGDGDRIIVVTPDKTVLDGDDILWYISHLEPFNKESCIIGTSMSNQGLAQALKSKNQTLIRAAVGDKNVASAMKQHQATLGGEPSGHIIMGPQSYIADGLLAALLCIQAHQNQAIAPLRKWAQIHKAIPLKEKISFLDKEKLMNLQEDFSSKNATCRIVLRPSGTEPIIRLMVEGEDQILANNAAKELESRVHDLLK